MEEGTNKKLAEDVVQIKNIGDQYETEVSEEVLKTYDFLTKTENWQGTIQDTETIEVTYYYKLKEQKPPKEESAQVITHHLEQGTNKKLAEDVVQTKNIGDQYETEVSEEVLKTYDFATKTENWQGVVQDTETIEVTYYYTQKEQKIENQIKKDETYQGYLPQTGQTRCIIFIEIGLVLAGIIFWVKYKKFSI